MNTSFSIGQSVNYYSTAKDRVVTGTIISIHGDIPDLYCIRVPADKELAHIPGIIGEQVWLHPSRFR